MFFRLRLKRNIFPLPVFETERLIFRPMTMDDLNDLYDLASLSKTVEHLEAVSILRMGHRAEGRKEAHRNDRIYRI